MIPENLRAQKIIEQYKERSKERRWKKKEKRKKL